MTFLGWRFALFTLLGSLGILLLATLDVTGREAETVDRHTGRRLRPLGSMVEILHSTRVSGDALLALEGIRRQEYLIDRSEDLQQMVAVLEAELSSRLDPPLPAHPARERIENEQTLAREAAGELERLAFDHLALDHAVEILVTLEADRAVAEASERLFTDGPPPGDRVSLRASPPDRAANYALEQLESLGRAEPLMFEQVAGAFQARERPRGRMRWLLRGVREHPENARCRLALVRAYQEYGRLQEAYLFSAAALQVNPDDAALWRERATMAAWQNDTLEEIRAREQLLQLEEDHESWQRLVDLYRSVGRPESAMPHAARLAEGDSSASAFELPARLALEGGQVGEAIDFLAEAAERSDEPWRWRERLVLYAIQDVRIDRAIEELRALDADYPDRGYRAQLEALYRRRNMHVELAELYAEKLAEEPDNKALQNELISLYVETGQQDRVVELLTLTALKGTDPRNFFQNLAAYQAAGVPGLRERAITLITGQPVEVSEVSLILNDLTALLTDSAWREVARLLVARVPSAADRVTFRIRLLDHEATPEDGVREARRLFEECPASEVALREWVDRSRWTGMTDEELAARLVYTERHPGDLVNRVDLLELCEISGRGEEALEHLRFLSERLGPLSPEAERLTAALFAANHIEEALDWLERRANAPQASLEEKLRVADHLFAQERLDRAQIFYLAVLDEDQDHRVALLRTGQIHLWSNDPTGAVDYFERGVEVAGEGDPELLFHLGEACWEIRRPARARDCHEKTLDLLIPKAGRSKQEDLMTARALVRLERPREARPIYETLLAGDPANVNLMLDFADAMLTADLLDDAAPLVARAISLTPDDPRALRMQARYLVRRQRFPEAAAALRRVVADTRGVDAGLETSLGFVLNRTGEWGDAAEAYRRAGFLQPDNRDVQESLTRLDDQLADLAALRAEFYDVDRDSAQVVETSGSYLQENERTRWSASAGAGWFSGRAQAVQNGNQDVDETVSLLKAALSYRHAASTLVGGGLNAYPGAPGDTPLGLWTGAYFEDQEPFRSLRLRLHYHDLLQRPAAAVGLEGRTSGVEAAVYREIDRRWWTSGQFALEWLEVDPPGRASSRDWRATAGVSLGYVLRPGSTALGEVFRTDRLPHGLLGPHLVSPDNEEAHTAVTAWASYYTIQLLGDEDVADQLPLGEDFHYLTLSSEVDTRLARTVGAMTTGTVGLELLESNLFWNLGGGVAWRPRDEFTLRLSGSVGRSVDRADSTATSTELELGMTLRF